MMIVPFKNRASTISMIDETVRRDSIAIKKTDLLSLTFFLLIKTKITIRLRMIAQILKLMLYRPGV